MIHRVMDSPIYNQTNTHKMRIKYFFDDLVHFKIYYEIQFFQLGDDRYWNEIYYWGYTIFNIVYIVCAYTNI